MIKKIVCLATVAAAAGFVNSQASAEELWDPHLFGINEGLAMGALPPQGVYAINNSYFATFKVPQANPAMNNALKLDSYVDVPILLWSTGLKVLGADYGVGLAQPFDYTSIGPAGSQAAHWGTYNTLVIPAILAWTLPYDFHVSASLGIYADDASSSFAVGHTPAYGVGAGMANWTFEPGVSVSWLHDGWNITLETYYDASTQDGNSAKTLGITGLPGSYQSGDEFGTSFTIMKTIGKWSGGLGGYTLNQLQRDQINGVSAAGTVDQKIGLGPIVGYNFGPVELQAMYNHDVVDHYAPGGDFFNVRLIVPFK